MKVKKVKVSKEQLREHLYRRRFLVPNAVTVANLFCGFLAIIYAASGRFEKAAIAIGLAILLDGMDGRMARRLNATSKFGVEFDSFSDLISFGLAPAVLIYHWCFQTRADEFGVFACFIYAICAAGRLARFNTKAEDLHSFQGMPTPGAAGMVAALVFLIPSIEQTILLASFGTFLMLSLGGLMVSDIRFFSVKHIQIANMRIMAIIGLGTLIALIWYNPKVGLIILASVYCLSGPIDWLLKRRHSSRNKKSDTVKLSRVS